MTSPSPADQGGLSRLARGSAIAGGAVVVNGLLSAAVLAVCSALHQTGQIAAYTVVTSVLAFVTILLGGGSAMLYLNGTEHERALVRSQWSIVVVPGLVLGAVGTAVFYAHRGYDPGALAAAGVVALGNGLATLQIADYTRRMRFLANAVLQCGSKAASLVLVLAGVPLTVSLAVAGVAQLVAGELALGKDGSLRRGTLRRPSLRDVGAAYRAGGPLFGYATGDLYTARLGTVALSLAAGPAVLGPFGAVAAAYQAIGNVVQAALQVPMIARTRARLGIGFSHHRASFAIGVALVCAVPMAAAVAALAPFLTGTILSLSHRSAAAWLTLFMLALPFMAVTRALMFEWIGDGRYGRATRAVALLAAVTTVCVAVGVPRFGPFGAAGATAAAEALTLALLLALHRRGFDLNRG
ncbi:polysaccharide biosynthesis C-terminal domain-containing protein [Dactylosporangium sp. CA-139066]|uniref:polysaccharide biosynthesis C-terminal domain-containing protein n=1 Tax=Dactylosporangium sp. CA-139066 TaxID=3239930 RepID=UPI003D9417E0